MSVGRSRTLTIYGLGALLLVAAGYLVFELGRYQSGFSALDHRRQVAALTAKLDEERATSDELRRQLAIAETSGEIDRATYSEVESKLADLQAKIQSQEEELVFYRGIVSPQDGVAGLRIQSLEILPEDAERRYLLRIVLVQAIVHSRRVSGTVKLNVEGLLNGQSTSYDVGELISDGAAYDGAYEFRYFQGLETELTLPIGFEPQRLHLEVDPSESRAERINQTFEWSVVAG